MSDYFDFSLDAIEPESVDKCKFDEVIPYRLRNNDTLHKGDVELINRKILEEYNGLARVYFDNVTYKETNCEYLSEVKDYINGRDFDDTSVENSYKQSIIEAGYTAENIDEHISKAKADLENGREYFESTEQNLYTRIYDTAHCDSIQGVPVECPVYESTIKALGEPYEAYCKSREADKSMESSVDVHAERVSKANNLTSNIVAKQDDMQKE